MIYYSSLFNTKSSAEISWNWFLLATYVSIMYTVLMQNFQTKKNKKFGTGAGVVEPPCTVVAHYNSFSNPTL